MIAALPMYDRPELRPHTDALWSGIRDTLRDLGVAAPQTLTRNADPWDIWQSPDLILAQTCGLPYRARLHDQVALVATPDYGLPGCPPGYYQSVIIARSAALPDRPRAAINDPLSQSGWSALRVWADAQAMPLDRPFITGAHAASARAVAQGKADIAAIDAQTWRHLIMFDQADPSLEIARTAPTPGLPLITAPTQDPALIRQALTTALAALPEKTRLALDLRGFAQIDAKAYLALAIPPNP